MPIAVNNGRVLESQTYVEWLTQDTLNLVAFNYRQGTPYVDVDLKNQANAEASAMRDYRGRYLFELLQNANDAIIAAKDDPNWAKKGRYRVRIELTHSALIVANDGVPFLEKDVDSIYRWGESSKDPNKSIGHKGIGFKSVLEITESPQVFSQVVQFHFDRETCYEAVRKIVGNAAELKLPITRFVFPHSIDSLPSPDRELVRDLLYKAGFATVVRLTLRVSQDRVLERIDKDINPALILFLNGIDEIEQRAPGRPRRVLYKKVGRSGKKYVGQDITLLENRALVSRWLLFDAPKREIADRAIIAELEDQAWNRVQKVGFALAFPLDERGELQVEIDESSKLFVYFPTDVSAGLRYRLHGDFYIDAARKQINPRDYNLWLARQIASFTRSTVVPELANRFARDARVVQMLVPCAEPTSEFADSLRGEILRELQECPFVPTANGKPVPPDRLMLAPLGASVDTTEFRHFFPPSELSQLHGGRAFPLAAIECDIQASEFLIQLGAKRLTFQDVFGLFDGRDLAGGPANYPDLYRFLWNWREELAPLDKHEFSQALQYSKCVAAERGSWIRPHERLYHAKLRLETPNMPRTIQVDLVHPKAYDAGGRDSLTYKLLNTLSPPVRDYDAREIIQNGIVPLFEGERFKRLSLEERAEVYRYLFDYWRTRRGSGDPEVERVKGLVQVPARPITNRRRDEWRPVTDVYLSSVWSDDDRLEQLYEGFEGVAFLYDVRGLDLQPEEYQEWGRFWEWLGVSVVPRILVDEVPAWPLDSYRWQHIRHDHRHAGTGLWLDYLEEMKIKYSRCPSHGKGYRQLRRSIALEGFAELVERQDAERLVLLYQLLAEDWPRFNRHNFLNAEVYCYRVGCPQRDRSREIPSFFAYLLRAAEWIPTLTTIDGSSKAKLRKPNLCWFVAEAENPVIRNLLPTPPAAFARPEHRQFCRDIGMRFVDEAQLDDLVDMLRHLPEEYPDPNVTVRSGRRSVPGALSTFSRWVIERINNLLTPFGDKDRPQLEEPIPLVAREGDALRYVYPPEPAFFANDRYHSPRWRDHLPFAPLDENWQDAARYLNLNFISEHVEESCAPGTILEAESNRLENRFKVARPYMLAVVSTQRGSATQEVGRYLSNLEMRVVDSLTVHRHLTIPPEKVVTDPEAGIYLQETVVRRKGSAGRAPRGGVLYVRRGFEENYDLLAGPIAEYIRIPGLADAFVILLDRGGKEGRLRFLATRGLDDEHVQEMRNLLGGLGITDEPEASESELDDDDALHRYLLEQLQQRDQDQESQEERGGGTEDTSRSTPSSQQQGATDRTHPQEPPIQFPELDLSQVKTTFVSASNNLELPDMRRGKGAGGGGSPNWERNQRLREAYGRRGEELVKKLQIEHLRSLGVAEPERYVRWLREERNETADHDLESRELVDGKWVDMLIEVKATPTSDFRMPMSRDEIACARNFDHYRLYRVIDVASASPQVYVFENPYKLWQEGKALFEPRDTYLVLPDPRKKDTDEEVTGDDV